MTDNDGNFIAERSKEEEENEKSKLYKLTQNLREDEQQGNFFFIPKQTQPFKFILQLQNLGFF